MDFVTRLKRIVNQPQTSIDHIDSNSLLDKPTVARYRPQNGIKGTFSEDPQVIRTLIESIPPRFYNNNSEVVLQEEIIEFCSDREIPKAQTRISKLATHNKAVCRRIYQLVLEKQSQYQSELNGVLELQKENLDALTLCQSVRQNMSVAMQGLVLSRLTVLLNYRRKSRLVRVAHSLDKIRTLQMSVESLLDLLNKEDFCNAIKLYIECQAVVDDFVFYNCIDKMRKKLKTIRVNIEEALDSALMRTCENFDSTRYGILQNSFSLLGGNASSIDQLQMHYASIIQNRSLKVVMEFSDNVSSSLIIDSSAYSECCKAIPQNKFIACLQKLCSSLFEIIRCYQATILWHKQSMTQESDISIEKQLTRMNSGDHENPSTNWTKNYQLERLLNNKCRLWNEISGRIKLLVEQSQLNSSNLDLNDVMKLLNIINKFTTVGVHFCDSQSLDLQDSVRTKFQDFFRSFHLKHLERLKMFLENELWELCPVKKSFSFLDLAEFASFKQSQNSSIGNENINSANMDYTDEIFSLSNENPFNINMLPEKPAMYKENIMGDDTQEHVPLSHSLSDEDSQYSLHSGPIIANTTLEVCRLIGRYIEIMRLLKPIAMDIVNSLCQLYDYYMFSVYHIFCENLLKQHSDLEMVLPRHDNNRLGVVLRRIWDRLIWHNDSQVVEKSSQDHRIDLPYTNNQGDVDLLSQSIVAVESLVYLGQSLLRDNLLNFLNDCLPEAKRGLLKIFSEQNLMAGQQLRTPMFDTVLTISYKTDRNITPSIVNTNWNIKSVATNCSDYVAELQNIIRQFQTRLRHLSIRVPITKELNYQLWFVRTRLIDRCLLDGYSGVTSCSQAGRNLMLIDWQLYVKCVASCSGFNDLFDQNDVERYIKAYYCGIVEFEQYLRDNCDKYSRNQLVNLINLLTRNDKKLRQRWTNQMTELIQKTNNLSTSGSSAQLSSTNVAASNQSALTNNTGNTNVNNIGNS